jgi:hypothetical protein
MGGYVSYRGFVVNTLLGRQVCLTPGDPLLTPLKGVKIAKQYHEDKSLDPDDPHNMSDGSYIEKDPIITEVSRHFSGVRGSTSRMYMITFVKMHLLGGA